MSGAVEIPLTPLTKAERIASAIRVIEGGQKLCTFLTEEGQRAANAGDSNSALMYSNEAEGVLRLVKSKQTELAAIEAERVEVAIQKKYPSFFERREIHATAVALHKSDDVVLAERANLATANRRDWKTQKVNRNIAPARQGVDTMLSMASGGSTEGNLARCSRYCKDARGNDIQGRNCPVCKGIGFNAHKRIREAKCAQ
jgi:hypothetical protein